MLRNLAGLIIAVVVAVNGSCKAPRPPGGTVVCNCGDIPRFNLADTLSLVDFDQETLENNQIEYGSVVSTITNCSITIGCEKPEDAEFDTITPYFVVFTEDGQQYSSDLYEDIQDDIAFTCDLQNNEWKVDGKPVKNFGCYSLVSNLSS